MCRLIFSTFIILFVTGARCSATEVAYAFSGEVGTVFGQPYGHPIPKGTVASGSIAYDPDSPPTTVLTTCDCAVYRQQRSQGFRAKFGDLVVTASDYVVRVSNNVPYGASQTPSDIFSVIYSNLTYGLELPIVVGGVPHSVGYLTTLLVDTSATLYDSSALPPALDFGDFDRTETNFFSDSPQGAPDILFGINNLVEASPGDFDLDGAVDEHDYDVWKHRFGLSNELFADGNRNGIVDASDYVVWRDHTMQPLSQPTAVSEPAFVPLMLSIFLSSWYRAR